MYHLFIIIHLLRIASKSPSTFAAAAPSFVTCSVKCLDGMTLSLLCSVSCNSNRQICLNKSPVGGLVPCESGLSKLKRCFSPTGICEFFTLGIDWKTSCSFTDCCLLVSNNCCGFIYCRPCSKRKFVVLFRNVSVLLDNVQVVELVVPISRNVLLMISALFIEFDPHGCVYSISTYIMSI